MRGKCFISTLYYNRGKGESEHLNMNIKMFKELGITCVSFRIIPMTLFRRGDILYSLTNLIAGFRLLAAFYALALKMYFRILVLDHQTIEPFLQSTVRPVL